MSYLGPLWEPVSSHVVADSNALSPSKWGDERTYRTPRSSSLYVKALPNVPTHPINACEIHGTAQTMNEKKQPDRAYPSQSATPLSLQGLLLILASTQRDLQNVTRGRVPAGETVLTTSAWLDLWRKTLNISGCLSGLTSPFESYCVEYVKATPSGLEGGVCIQHREDLGYGKS